MAKYKSYLDNWDAIQLRTYAEQWRTANEKYRRAREAQASAAHAKYEADSLVYRYETEMRKVSIKMTDLLAKKVWRYIEDGELVILD